jgi:hypothetical protein
MDVSLTELRSLTRLKARFGVSMKRIANFTAQTSLEEHSDAGNAPSGNAPSGAAPSGDMIPASRRTQLFRVAGSWLGFTGLYAATGGTCPFCGQPTCPTGFLSAGIVGGVLAIGLQAWRRFHK